MSILKDTIHQVQKKNELEMEKHKELGRNLDLNYKEFEAEYFLFKQTVINPFFKLIQDHYQSLKIEVKQLDNIDISTFLGKDIVDSIALAVYDVVPYYIYFQKTPEHKIKLGFTCDNKELDMYYDINPKEWTIEEIEELAAQYISKINNLKN